MKKLMIAATLLLGACVAEPTDMAAYTLYRTPLAGNDMLHVATFDAGHGADYNRENCEIVARLMQNQPGVTVAYVCRVGRHLS